MAVDFKRLEKILKGSANHWRLRILFLLNKQPDLSLFSISDELGGNFKTISEHTRKLFSSGLIEKRCKGRVVLHSVSSLGKVFLSQIDNRPLNKGI
jgi:predicted transcriptional regulator